MRTKKPTAREESEKRKGILRTEIMLTMKANNVYISGETWFNLVFMTESNLKTIAHELHIQTA